MDSSSMNFELDRSPELPFPPPDLPSEERVRCSAVCHCVLQSELRKSWQWPVLTQAGCRSRLSYPAA